MSKNRLDISDLKRYCSEREQESLTLEFKPCNELKIGSRYRVGKDDFQIRTKDAVLDELTKDVTAFLNATGGTIIYGIRETKKTSRAEALDRENAFSRIKDNDDVQADKVAQWLGAHIQPSPPIQVYSVLVEPTSQDFWYLIIEIPQGNTAYMAKDHKFYKRTNASAKQMEQYEVIDVMNRTKAAALDVIASCAFRHSNKPDWDCLNIDIAVTSTNFIASEYGAIRITTAPPILIDGFSGATFGTTDLSLDGGNDIPNAQTAMTRWGAHNGNVVFPGDWFNFHNNGVRVLVPGPTLIRNPLYLFQIELFTLNSLSRKILFAICHGSMLNQYDISRIEAFNFEETLTAYWQTYNKLES